MCVTIERISNEDKSHKYLSGTKFFEKKLNTIKGVEKIFSKDNV